jgi:hypothetical protein
VESGAIRTPGSTSCGALLNQGNRAIGPLSADKRKNCCGTSQRAVRSLTQRGTRGHIPWFDRNGFGKLDLRPNKRKEITQCAHSLPPLG